ncbi:hypothetical protein [Saccharothrix deserti]|uniref:hypothetical protein n=1 Tax=Saccharothrix deserti TaxID=2593674 RepID=UPI0023677059|nr:hypothetical protein [Saccharothrix deserti]
MDNPGSNNPPGTRLRVFQDDRVRFFGQPVAVAVATSLEAAQHAASLVEVTYAALLEHTVADPPDGRIVNADLADYLVPVNADVPDLRAIYLRGNDPEANPIGVKGLGEIVLVGIAPAVGNAVFHATGRRVRDFPIAADTLL